jgi:hypothetical protein
MESNKTAIVKQNAKRLIRVLIWYRRFAEDTARRLAFLDITSDED